MHLTNYAINKEHNTFIQNYDAAIDYVGHKRSLSSIFKHIDSICTQKYVFKDESDSA
jgi:hypothetical protein